MNGRGPYSVDEWVRTGIKRRDKLMEVLLVECIQLQDYDYLDHLCIISGPDLLGAPSVASRLEPFP